MRVWGTTLLLAATGLALPAAWLHNPRERTAQGISAWQKRDFTRADRALDEAMDLAGPDARTLYNAGTGKLGAGAPGPAAPLLAKSAAARGPERPDALYNLGNAYLAAGEAKAAIDAYVGSLRQRPGYRPAQHNLELALRELEQQQQKSQQQQPPPSSGGGQGKGGGGGGGQPPPDQQPPQQGGGGQQGQQQQQPQPGGGQAQTPQFHDQKDMSAQQAAALLEAVENLEREQRRARAEQERQERAKQTSEKDW